MRKPVHGGHEHEWAPVLPDKDGRKVPPHGVWKVTETLNTDQEWEFASCCLLLRNVDVPARQRDFPTTVVGMEPKGDLDA